MKQAFGLITFLVAFGSFAAELADPLNSPSWELMHKVMLNNESVVFDDRVIVNMPDLAEDPLNVPVSIRVEDLADIQQIVVFGDLNPIQKILSFEPRQVKPYLSFRIKVEQATPIRAAVKTADGVWHVGGKWVDAAGGGCTAPSVGTTSGSWYETLMDVSARSWQKGDRERLRFRIMHPMDTGLASNIPEFYLKHFDVLDGDGVIVAKLDTYQPISENPVFSVEVNKDIKTPISLRGTDNNGNRLEANINKE